MDKLKWQLARFFYGRYGMDRLNIVLYVSSLVLLVFGWFGQTWLWTTLSQAILLYALYRICSKQIAKRRREYQIYLQYEQTCKRAYTLARLRIQDRSHRTFACPQCGQLARVPKGRGKLMITCPKCRTTFDRKS
ncbi:MAG: hypothetical protein ACRCZJ_06565 [Erysipelotrichaceae bacterium]